MVSLSIANTVSDLIQGDVNEHLPLERIPLEGDVLGLGTTTSFDNGELTFLHQPGAARTHLYKCQSLDGGIRRLLPGVEVRVEEGWDHFPMLVQPDDYARVVAELALELGARSDQDEVVGGRTSGKVTRASSATRAAKRPRACSRAVVRARGTPATVAAAATLSDRSTASRSSAVRAYIRLQPSAGPIPSRPRRPAF